VFVVARGAERVKLKLGFPWENGIRAIGKIGMRLGYGKNKLGNETRVQFGLKNEIYSSFGTLIKEIIQ